MSCEPCGVSQPSAKLRRSWWIIPWEFRRMPFSQCGVVEPDDKRRWKPSAIIL